jgi:hypothetical protein
VSRRLPSPTLIGHSKGRPRPLVILCEHYNDLSHLWRLLKPVRVDDSKHPTLIYGSTIARRIDLELI